MKITKPGFHFDMSETDYRNDPCPSASLTQSLVKVVLDKSPLHAWYLHPKLNPDFKSDAETKFDVGNITHKLMLGRGKEIIVLPAEYEDWRKVSARDLREKYAKEGKLAVLGKHHAKADRMVRAAREQLARIDMEAFRPETGNGEVVIAWKEDFGWCRSLVDWVSKGNRAIYDLKTTQESAAPHAIPRKLAADGWAVQAAFIERGLDALDPSNIGRRTFIYVCQEDEVPHSLTVTRLSESAMTMGRKMVRHAMQIWAECLKHNVFPSYPPEIIAPEYPGWAESQWLDREIHEAARDRTPRKEPMITEFV